MPVYIAVQLLRQVNAPLVTEVGMTLPVCAFSQIR